MNLIHSFLTQQISIWIWESFWSKQRVVSFSFSRSISAGIIWMILSVMTEIRLPLVQWMKLWLIDSFKPWLRFTPLVLGHPTFESGIHLDHDWESLLYRSANHCLIQWIVLVMTMIELSHWVQLIWSDLMMPSDSVHAVLVLWWRRYFTQVTPSVASFRWTIMNKSFNWTRTLNDSSPRNDFSEFSVELMLH